MSEQQPNERTDIMSESIVYPATIYSDGSGRVEMVHESVADAAMPFDLILPPAKAEEWNNASNDARRDAMALVALTIRLLVEGQAPIPFAIKSERDVVAGYNFLILTTAAQTGEEPSHTMQYVEQRGFTPPPMEYQNLN